MALMISHDQDRALFWFILLSLYPNTKEDYRKYPHRCADKIVPRTLEQRASHENKSGELGLIDSYRAKLGLMLTYQRLEKVNNRVNCHAIGFHEASDVTLTVAYVSLLLGGAYFFKRD